MQYTADLLLCMAATRGDRLMKPRSAAWSRKPEHPHAWQLSVFQSYNAFMCSPEASLFKHASTETWQCDCRCLPSFTWWMPFPGQLLRRYNAGSWLSCSQKIRTASSQSLQSGATGTFWRMWRKPGKRSWECLPRMVPSTSSRAAGDLCKQQRLPATCALAQDVRLIPQPSFPVLSLRALQPQFGTSSWKQAAR